MYKQGENELKDNNYEMHHDISSSLVNETWTIIFFVAFFNFLIWVFNVSSISNLSFADASSSNITRLTLPMPMACQEQ